MRYYLKYNFNYQQTNLSMYTLGDKAEVNHQKKLLIIRTKKWLLHLTNLMTNEFVVIFGFQYHYVAYANSTKQT